MKLLSIAVASLALLATPALAQNSVTNWTNGSYDVTGSSVGEKPVCIMTSTFEIAGRSDVKFYLTWDGEMALFSLASSGWSADKDKEYNDFGYYFPTSDSLFDGGVTTGIVFDYIYKGFLTAFDSDFLDKLAAENRLFVARDGAGEDDVTVVADLNLTGTGTAVAALRRCATFVANREAARIRRESRNDYIERDPFKN